MELVCEREDTLIHREHSGEEFGIKNPLFLKIRVSNNFGIFLDE